MYISFFFLPKNNNVLQKTLACIHTPKQRQKVRKLKGFLWEAGGINNCNPLEASHQLSRSKPILLRRTSFKNK